MAIYNFKPQFAAAIRSGAKAQTIRAHGKRPPPKVGNWAYCYTGLRTQTLAWWPVSLVCAVVEGYHEAFFAAFLRDDPWTR